MKFTQWTKATGFLLACMLGFAGQALAQGVVFSRTDFGVGSAPSSVITADFNADGKLDLAVANSGSNSVSILLGAGDGTFGTRTDFPTGTGPRCVAAGDFNGDNRLDLVTADSQGNTVSVLLGNGDGTFGARTAFAVGNGPVFVAVAALNAGGEPDLAVVNKDADTISVLLGNGDGTFGAKTDFVTGAMPQWLIVADLNGDGKPDLASANPGSHTVSVLLGNGDGNFAAKQDFATGMFPRSVVAADFRKMMKLDLATANTHDSTTSILLGKGDGTFDPRTDLGTDTGPISIASADFDNDGKPDLLTGNFGFSYTYYGYFYFYPTVSLLRGNGDGTFATRADFAIGFSLSPDPMSIATGDFNGDGRMDAAVVKEESQSVAVLLQVPVITLSTDILRFSTNQPVGVTTAAQTVTVSSEGAVNLAIGSVSVTGQHPGDFSKTGDTCSGQAIAPGSNCEIQVTFTPSASGARNARLLIPNNSAPGAINEVELFGAGQGTGIVSPSPGSLDFGDQFVGTTSQGRDVTLTNTGTQSVTVLSLAVSSPDFGVSAGNCAPPLAVSASCTATVFFNPTSVGAKAASLEIQSDTAGSPNVVMLTGNGVPPAAVSLTPTTVDFGNQPVGTTSAPRTVTLTNSGGSALTISGLTINNPFNFAQTNNCPVAPASLAAGAMCQISISFTPTGNLQFIGSVSVNSNAPGSPHAVQLFGRGGSLPAVELAPNSLSFGSQAVGSPSAAQTIDVRNRTGSPVTFSGIALTGMDAGEFTQTNNCPNPLQVGSQCQVQVVFNPASAGAKSAALSVASDAPGSPHAAMLSGTGVTPPSVTLAPASLSFTGQLVGTTSAAQTITLTNSGGSALTISGMALGGANAADFTRSENCGNSVNAGASCTIMVTFRAGAVGMRSATITITDNAAGSPRQVDLSGSGMDFTVQPAAGSPNQISISAGQTANFQLSLTASGGFSGMATVGCTGTIPAGMCSAPQGPVSFSEAAPATVTISVTTTAHGLLAPRGWPRIPRILRIPMWLFSSLIALACAMWWWRSTNAGGRPLRLVDRMSGIALVLLVLLAAGCSGSGTVPPMGTPAGTYSFTVNVAAGGATRTTGLTMVVR